MKGYEHKFLEGTDCGVSRVLLGQITDNKVVDTNQGAFIASSIQ